MPARSGCRDTRQKGPEDATYQWGVVREERWGWENGRRAAARRCHASQSASKQVRSCTALIVLGSVTLAHYCIATEIHGLVRICYREVRRYLVGVAHCLLVYLLLPSQHCVPHSVAMGEKAPRFAWGSALRLSSWNHPPDWMRKDWAGNDFFPPRSFSVVNAHPA